MEHGIGTVQTNLCCTWHDVACDVRLEPWSLQCAVLFASCKVHITPWLPRGSSWRSVRTIQPTLLTLTSHSALQCGDTDAYLPHVARVPCGGGQGWMNGWMYPSIYGYMVIYMDIWIYMVIYKHVCIQRQHALITWPPGGNTATL